MKIKIYATESFTTYVSREAVELETDDYPELEGMSEDEIKDYIRQNADTMSPTEGQEDYYSDLNEELYQSDVVREKITDEQAEIEFE
jgi:GTPase Era involved in 16S rRNA processing